jgi:co-chaperonin GroES (HSP10)
MPFMLMEHEVDPREKLLKDLGDLSQVEIFNNQLLVAVYLRPEKTKSGFYLPDQNREEDKFQSKVGLLVKMGPSAFEASGAWFKDLEINLHDWLIVRPSDSWSLTVNGVLCRIVEDSLVKGRVPHPDAAW